MKFIKHISAFALWAFLALLVLIIGYFKAWPIYWRRLKGITKSDGDDDKGSKINFDELVIYHDKPGMC